jgi:hypothetical protein
MREECLQGRETLGLRFSTLDITRSFQVSLQPAYRRNDVSEQPSSISREEAVKFESLTDEELLVMMVPDSETEVMYSFDGLVARGRQIFNARLAAVKNVICDVYRSREASADRSIDLVILLATALIGSPVLAGIPVLAFAALVVKIGLSNLCESD